MKRESIEALLEKAQNGYLTKDEYRALQKKIKLDHVFRERAVKAIAAEGLGDPCGRVAEMAKEVSRHVYWPDPPSGEGL